MPGSRPFCCQAWTPWSTVTVVAAPSKLTPQQQKRLVELIEAGPLVVGFETACWNSVLIRVLIWREFGVLYNCHYVCTLLHKLVCKRLTPLVTTVSKNKPIFAPITRYRDTTDFLFRRSLISS